MTASCGRPPFCPTIRSASRRVARETQATASALQDAAGFWKFIDAQAGHDPTLQIFPGHGSRKIGRLPACTANREKIVAGDNDRKTGRVSLIHRVPVIADVDEANPGRKLLFQPAGEEDELVEIGEPLRDKAPRELDFAETGLRMEQLGVHPSGGEMAQHHGRKTLHALLLIGRVVTDQEDHEQDEKAGSRCASGRRTSSAAGPACAVSSLR